PAPPAESGPGRSRPLRVAGDLLRTAKGTRLVKALAFRACRPSYANRAPYGCGFLSTRVLLSWSLLCLSMGPNTLFATDRAIRRHRYRPIGGSLGWSGGRSEGRRAETGLDCAGHRSPKTEWNRSRPAHTTTL